MKCYLLAIALVAAATAKPAQQDGSGAYEYTVQKSSPTGSESVAIPSGLTQLPGIPQLVANPQNQYIQQQQQQQYAIQPNQEQPINIHVPIGVEEKKIYLHLPPAPPQPNYYANYPQPPPRKHYKIILVRSPTPATPPPPPPTPAVEEQTIVYVLVKKPDELTAEEIEAAQPAYKSHKPEVYFIKYKENKDAGSEGAAVAGAIQPSASGQIDGSASDAGYLPPGAGVAKS